MTDLERLKILEKEIGQPLEQVEKIKPTTNSYIKNVNGKIVALAFSDITLQKLPISLKSIDALEYVQFSFCKISDYSLLKELKGLVGLGFHSNEIESFHFLEYLTKLKSLYIYNEIINVKYLSNLKKLKQLDINKGNIHEISFISNIANLELLDISDNYISDISYIKNLNKLKSLKISNNRISNAECIRFLSNLKVLELVSNNVSDFKFLSHLNKLEFLDITANPISDCSFLTTQTQLKNLGIGFIRPNDISFISNLKKLNSLYLRASRISDIQTLLELPVLKYLNLSGNAISNIDFLWNETELQYLNLSHNQITDIEPLVPLIQKGLTVSLEEYSFDNGLYLYKNPITNPPLEIVRQGNEAILNFFKQKEEQGEAPMHEARIMILGEGGAGKTSFADLQLNPDFEVDPSKLEQSTLGVTIHKNKPYAHQNTEKAGVEILAHLWDFGGQDTQKMLHQFFITEDCFYVLVSDKRKENTRFDYWFQIIQLLGAKSRVLVIENPIQTDNSVVRDFPLTKYKDLYPELSIAREEVNFLYARRQEKRKWEALTEQIERTLSAMDIVNREVPKKWPIVRDALAKKRNEKYISRDAYYALCAAEEIDLSPTDADYCLSHLRALGDLTYFEDRHLRNRIFLDHNWLIQGLYFILSEPRFQEQKGEFSLADAYAKWGEKGYGEEEKKMLLDLLLKDGYDLCYELPACKDRFVAPLLLPNDKPESWPHETQLYFRYRYGFMPYGLVSRLVVRVHEKIEDEKRWVSGVRLKDGETYAEIEYKTDPESNQQVIDIKLSGKNPKELLAFIRTEMSYLHKGFPNLKPIIEVGCNCAHCKERMKSRKKPTFYNYREIEKKLANRKFFVECEQNNYEDVNIGQVLRDIVVENAAEKSNDQQLLNLLKQMGMSINHIENSNSISNSGNSTVNVGQEQQNQQAQKNEQSQTTTVTVDLKVLKELTGQAELLKEDVEKELERKNNKLPEAEQLLEDEVEDVKDDVQVAETALKEVEAAIEKKEEPPAKAKTRLKQFVDDLSDEKSTLRKGIGLLRRGKDYGVKILARYNTIAADLGLEAVPESFLDFNFANGHRPWQ